MKPVAALTTLFVLALATFASFASVTSASDDIPVTVKVYFDIEHEGKDVGRIIMDIKNVETSQSNFT
jgi:peptidyl-prolyl cis-trans isomerase B (cyclophilin B)